MPGPKSAFSDEASYATRLLSPDPEFDALVFRSLKPLSFSLAVIFAVFVVLGFFDDSAGDARPLIVATDALSALFYFGLYAALAARVIPRALTFPLGLVIASIPVANALLAFALTGNPFFLSYLPMIAVVCGAYTLSLPWLLVTLSMILVSSYLVGIQVLPLVELLRYLPALIGAFLVALLMFFTRRWHIIQSHRALAAMRTEIEERKRAEERLAHAQRLESIGQLASGIAHDFNNLLTVIIGYTDSLLDAADKKSELHDDLQEIQRAGEKAGALAQKLLAFSRQQVMQPRVVNLNELVDSVESLIVRSLTGNVTLQFDLDPDAGSVNVDPLQLEQVLINLALNARDAMADDGGQLTIATAAVDQLPDGKEAALAEVRVSDTGCGMTDEVRNRVFEPFFTTKERGAGTGLGLAMVHGIVTQSGGSIDIDTAVGRGTTFTIRLPRAESSAALTPVGQMQDEKPTLAGVTVLVVDDEQHVADIVARTLQRHGAEVHVANSADDALQLAGREPFDLLLTDVVMPGMSGVELVQALKDRGHEQPALLMSGHAADKIPEAGSPVAPLLHKPFRAPDLVKAVIQAVASRPVVRDVPELHASPGRAGTHGGQLRILLVDDHELLLKLVSRMLYDMGHDCTSCSSPADAVNILREGHAGIDVVITDYSMPGMTGGELVELCSRDYPHIVTFISTGHDPGDNELSIPGTGPRAILPKPLTRPVLAAALQGVLETRQAET